MAAFKRAANAIKSSPWIIPITLAFVVAVIVSVLIMYEDYSTSLAGYAGLETRKANSWIVYVVALLPQLLQIILGYTFVEDNKKYWAAIGIFLAYSVDVFLDVYFKANGLGWESWVVAFIETNIIYTFGSEWLFLVSGGMLVQLLPHFLPQVSIFIGSSINGIISFFKSIGVNIENSQNDMPEIQAPEKRGRGRPPKEFSALMERDEYNS
jgi:hypothetical protein